MYFNKFPMLSTVCTIVVLSWFSGCGETSDKGRESLPSEILTDIPLNYVGADQCVNCHQQQHTSWQGSHHDLAMQEVSDKTVLGDFNDASFDYFGTISRFFKRDDQFFVRTDGPDGNLNDYPIAYVFGVFPLQQYLIKFPQGHLQALNIVWDARTVKDGGQRWFHLYPDEHIKHDDELHWTGINHNWNFMCADCHSTNLQKNYDLATKAFNTSWSELDVACEACHGPASRHIAWSEFKNPNLKDKGFSVQYDERDNVAWVIDPDTGNAKRSQAKAGNTEIEACAQCHSRRSTVKANSRPQHALLDNYRLSLLDDPLYHADGQINGEVYVYGSFVQSKMYHAGVTCSDCHQPHSLELRADGNQLCAQCHLEGKYDTEAHHLHTAGSDAALCVNCHMPAKNFMQVDARRDHSFRIPRPDLSVELGVPNACSHCHTDKSANWASAILQDKFGQPDTGHYAHAIQAGRYGLPNAEQLLAALIVDVTQPAIARATAVSLIPPFLSKQSAPILQLAANDEQPLLGFGLANALDNIPVGRRPPIAYPLLYDDMLSTRFMAARSILGSPLTGLPAEAQKKFNEALNEYESAQLFNADRPESLANLASFYSQQGQVAKAEQFFQDAITRAPYFTPAYANLADFYRDAGDDKTGEEVLRGALSKVRDKTPIQHSLGLLLVRQKRLSEALGYLRLAAESSSTIDHYVYVYAVALNSSGKTEQALSVLEQAQARYPNNTDILYALFSINHEQGNQQQAQYYENILRAFNR